ncbi:MAG: hypothetical protein FD166_2138 [Bacteroidetes bacterium]|nr:MAG: hypothetical protein FD166_2138 [Bacteroidota bacterium]
MNKHFFLIVFLMLSVNVIGFCQSSVDTLEAEKYNTDSLNGIYIPKDLNDCFNQIDGFWNDSIKNQVKSWTEEEFCANAHFGFGMWMRNNWGLWGGSRLQAYFNDKGIYHPDDMSGIILTSYYRYLKGDKIELKKQIKSYKTYWEKPDETQSFKAKTRNGKIFVDIDSALQVSDSIVEIDFIGFEKIPRQIKEFRNIKEINIESCYKIDIENAIKQISILESLEYISFFDNGFTEYPLSLGNLTQINKLWISGDSIKTLPSSIINLNSLVELNITECPNLQLDTLFSMISRLKNLRELDLSENGLSDLPMSLTKLTQLKELWLDDNTFTSIPESVKSLSNLEYLRFFSNNIDSLNITSGDLKSLKGIDLCYNKFDTFPMELTNLNNLESVVMWYNEISKLPEDIARLKNLKRLNLQHNNLDEQQKDKLKSQLPNTKLEL